MSSNQDQRQYWTEAAPGWLAAERAFERVGAEPGDRALDKLAPAPGATALDVGCGSGGTTLELARKVGPTGAVVGVDIAEPLVEEARRRAADAGCNNVTFLAADAETDDFGGNRFAAVYSRFGVMFFADPVAAFANIRSAMADDGHLSFVAWQNVLANEWILVPVLAAASATGAVPSPPTPGQPGPFSLSDADRVHAILDEAGFRSIDIDPVADAVVFAEDEIPLMVEIASGAGPVAEALRDADDARRASVSQAIEDALRSRADRGQIELSRAVLLVSAHR
jgi:SAM-dependent methyltransferase